MERPSVSGCEGNPVVLYKAETTILGEPITYFSCLCMCELDESDTKIILHPEVVGTNSAPSRSLPLEAVDTIVNLDGRRRIVFAFAGYTRDGANKGKNWVK